MIGSRYLRRAAPVVLALTLLSSCKDGGTPVDPLDRIDRVTVSPTDVSVGRGDTTRLTARVFDEDGADVTSSFPVTWSSSPSGRVIVDDAGLVTGLTDGEATVRAAVGAVSGQATVEVFDPTPPTAPASVVAAPVSDTEIDVAWSDRSSNEESFRIERERVGSGAPPASDAAAFEQVGTVGPNVTTYRDTGLEPGASYRYLVRACNRNGCRPEPGSQQEAGARSGDVVTYETLALETESLPDAFQNVAYEQALEASGGDAARSWSLAEGSLPDGLTLSADGTVGGTPTGEPGPSVFTVRVESGGQAVERELGLTVREEPLEPHVVTTELPDGDLGASYSAQLEAIGGDGTFTWERISGQIPPGLSLSASGAITGIPTQIGIYPFTVRVTSFDLTGTATLSIEVTSPLQVLTSSLPTAERTVGYRTTVLAGGGNGTYAWRLAAGSLPPGVGLEPQGGELVGTPTVVGTYPFTLEVTSGAQTVQKDLSLEVDPAPVVVGANLSSGYVGVAYSDVVTAGGGDGISYTFAVTGGALPSGVSLDPDTGELDGTPDTPGVYYFVVRASSAGRDASRIFAVAISGNAPGAFNISVLNVSAASASVPSAAVITAISDAVARWEQVIVGDLPDRTYGASEWPGSHCFGNGNRVNGESLDDMLVLLDIAPIDGPLNILGQAGACALRFPAVSPALSTTFGFLQLDVADLAGRTPHQLFTLVFHEIGHIVGIGTLWNYEGGTPLMSGANTLDPRYEGAGGNAEFVGTLGGGSQAAAKAPIEAGGGAGTAYVHWDEGEFDHEAMTGFIEASATMAISSMTVAAVGDFAYVVDLGAADPYSINGDCAPACGVSPAGVSGPGPDDIPLGDDVLRGPIAVELPDGEKLWLHPRGGGD